METEFGDLLFSPCLGSQTSELSVFPSCLLQLHVEAHDLTLFLAIVYASEPSLEPFLIHIPDSRAVGLSSVQALGVISPSHHCVQHL